MEDEILNEETGSEPSEEPSEGNEPEQAEGQEPELQTPETPPTPQAARAPETRYQSPYVNVPQTQSNVPAKYAHVLDDTQYAALREMASEIAEQQVSMALQAQAQQRAAAKQLGLPSDVIDEYGDDMRRHEMSVPANLRGTREGAMLSFNAAITERMLQTGDIRGVLKQAASYFGDEPSLPPQVQSRAPLPPEQRMTSPRTSARPVTPKKDDSPFANLKNSWGANDEEMRALMEASEEIGPRIGGRR
jgi:hypothetical protein